MTFPEIKMGLEPPATLDPLLLESVPACLPHLRESK
jgi:hypothetical protein